MKLVLVDKLNFCVPCCEVSSTSVTAYKCETVFVQEEGAMCECRQNGNRVWHVSTQTDRES